MLRQLLRLALVWLLALLTVSCGGGGDDVANSGGIGGTGISSGSISSFGSIFVNGFEFDLTGVPITIDDQSGTEGDLQLGQVVTVTTNIGTDGSVSVTKVDFDYNLEGPISSAPQSDPDGLTKTFTVLGTTVIVSVDDTIFAAGYGFNNILQNDFVQISGFFDSNDVLHAKYIAKAGVFVPGMEVEAKGSIAELNTVTKTFKLRGLTVTYAGADLSDVPGGLQNDLFVEVKGTLQDVGGDVSATKIELEGTAQNAVAAAVEGIITSFSSNSDFVIDGGNGPVHVDAGAAAFDPPGLPLRDDLEIEAEGSLVNGTLVATKVELRSALIKADAVVFDVQVPDIMEPRVGSLRLQFSPFPGEVDLQIMPPLSMSAVQVDDKTKMQDQGPMRLREFKLTDIQAGQFVRVKARQGAGGIFVATQIMRTSPRDIMLRGPADKPPTGSAGITGRVVSILGVRFDTDSLTDFEDINNASISPDDFFADVANQTLIKVKDKSPADGVADEVQFEN